MKSVLPIAILATVLPASAVVIGIEDFSYADGPIAGLNGGTGFNYDNFDGAVTTTASDWDNVGGAPEVVGGQLVTNGSSAQREYNGDLDDTGNAGNATNDGQDDHPRSGAIRGAGQVFYSVDLTRSSSAAWSGISSYDFGTERVFFGVTGGGAATDTIGIQLQNVGNPPVDAPDGTIIAGTIDLTDTVAYTLVAAVDFDNNLVGLFVNPDGADFWDPSNGNNSADVTLAYHAGNWSSAARLGSGGEASWDNLIFATTPTDVGLGIPEPSVALLGGLAGLFLLRRRR